MLQRGNAVCNVPALRLMTLERQVCIPTLEDGNEDFLTILPFAVFLIFS